MMVGETEKFVLHSLIKGSVSLGTFILDTKMCNQRVDIRDVPGSRRFPILSPYHHSPCILIRVSSLSNTTALATYLSSPPFVSFLSVSPPGFHFFFLRRLFGANFFAPPPPFSIFSQEGDTTNSTNYTVLRLFGVVRRTMNDCTRGLLHIVIPLAHPLAYTCIPLRTQAPTISSSCIAYMHCLSVHTLPHAYIHTSTMHMHFTFCTHI
jgi:hypothetical protein